VAAVFIPHVPLRTAEMRAALPVQVTHADAAHNVGRTALVVAALTGDRLELLSAMSEDRLHEPYRAAHFPQLPELIAAAVDAGALGAALSGAGSTVLALCDDVDAAERAGRAMAEAAAHLDLDGRALTVHPAHDGARVLSTVAE
jgi:homoserine kinase